MDGTFQQLKRHISQQLHTIMIADIDLTPYFEETLRRVQTCFAASNNKYYGNAGGVSPYHSGQYAILLYCLSNVMFLRDGSGSNAEKVYYLNKVLNGIDIFYAVKMPDIWNVEHPIGSVMGRAEYGNRFFFYQSCTVGGSNGKYPVIGSNVIMYSHSKVLGEARIGNNVILAANSYVRDRDIPDNSIVFGQDQNIVIKSITSEDFMKKTKHIWKYDEA